MLLLGCVEVKVFFAGRLFVGLLLVSGQVMSVVDGRFAGSLEASTPVQGLVIIANPSFSAGTVVLAGELRGLNGE